MQDDQIAITGLACRFPGGANTLQQFWQMMLEGRDGVRRVPEARWNTRRYFDPNRSAPGRMYVEHAAFIDQDIELFDAEFFGVSPREAAAMDPQQRILLEVAWEALEDAGVDLQHSSARRTGVFIGGFMADNHLNQLSNLNQYNIGSYSQIGSTLCILSNRISYALNLQGPSFTVDTACSSSLVAFHQACLSIKNGDCDQAIVGGSNIMFRPENPIGMCKAGMLAPDGRSKAFDARGDGYGRGEGVGVVVLKRLESAISHGDEIYALVRASGVNQDGRSEGITVPNGEAQASLASEMLERAKIHPNQIEYIEAHGTGTAVGDPIEISALSAAIGKKRDDGTRCYVGSVKPNIGHLEAAAGIAGVIKSCLILKHGKIPRLANLQQINPGIDFDGGGLSIPLDTIDFRREPGDRFVAINSFGYGGTNAHVVLQDRISDQPETAAAENHGDTHPIFVTAADEQSLAARAGDLSKLLNSGVALKDVAFSLAKRRTHLSHRLALVCSNSEDACDQLTHFKELGETSRGVAGTVPAKADNLAFVLSGMGPQWWGMGRELYRDNEVYRNAANEVDEAFKSISGWSIISELLKDESASRVTETEVAQPANFLLQASLAELWSSWGVKPTSIVGHSVGEISSAFLSGMLSMEDAAKVAFHRSRIQARAAGSGGMAAVGMSEDEALDELRRYEGRLSIAAINSPRAITISGDLDAIAAISSDLKGRGRFVRPLKVEVPYHSHLMDPLKADLLASLHDIRPQAPTVQVFSSVTGRECDADSFTPTYWVKNMRQEVRFMDAIAAMSRAGHSNFLEVGPHPVISGSVTETLKSSGSNCRVFHSLKRGAPEAMELKATFARMFVAGVPMRLEDSTCFSGRKVDLQPYPWQRKALWSETPQSLVERSGQIHHPLLGDKLSGPRPTWQNQLTLGQVPWLKDHRIQGSVIFPAAAYMEMATAAAESLPGYSGGVVLEDLRFLKPLVLTESEAVTLRTEYDSSLGVVKVFGMITSSDIWSEYFVTRAVPAALKPLNSYGGEGDTIGCREAINAEEFYRLLTLRKMEYGPSFRRIIGGSVDVGNATSMLRIQGSNPADGDDWKFHPTVLDSVLHGLVALIAEPEGTFVPSGVGSYSFFEKIDYDIEAIVKAIDLGTSQVSFDVDVIEPQSNLVVAELRAVSLHMLDRFTAQNRSDRWVLEFADSPRSDGIAPAEWIALGHGGNELIEELQSSGLSVGLHVSSLEDSILSDQPGGPYRIVDARFEGVLLDGEDTSLDTVYHIINGIQHTQSLNVDQYVLVLRVDHLGDETALSPGAEAAAALLRVAITEGAVYSTKIIFADRSTSYDELVSELSADDRESEVLVSSGRRLVRRLNQNSIIMPAVGGGSSREKPATHAFLFRDYLGSGEDLSAKVYKAGLAFKLGSSSERRLSAATITACDYQDAENLPLDDIYRLSLAYHLKPSIDLVTGRAAPGNRWSIRVIGIDRATQELIELAALLANIAITITDTDDNGRYDAIVTSGPLDPRQTGEWLPSDGEIILLSDDRQQLGRIATIMPPGARVRWIKNEYTADPASLSKIVSMLRNSSEAVERWMARATADSQSLSRQSHYGPVNGFMSSGAYLVTGGTGPVGLAIASMIAQQGGGHIVLLSRSGSVSSEQVPHLELIRSSGSIVHNVAADVSNFGDVMDVIGKVTRDIAPIRGIFHAAGAVSDATFTAITRFQLETAWNAKVRGASNLHVATQKLPLDHFVLISSISSLIGNAGQGSYSAANGFLNGLAAVRRSEGLAGLSLCLGPVASEGMAANVQDHLEAIGFTPYLRSELPDVLGRTLNSPQPMIGLARFDPRKFLDAYPTWRRSPRNIDALGLDEPVSEASDIQRILNLDHDSARSEMANLLAELISDSLKVDVSRVLSTRQLSDLGMDSLQAIETQIRIEDVLGTRVSTLDLLGDRGVHGLVDIILTALHTVHSELTN